MELIKQDYTTDYGAFKQELDSELNKAADGFVKIGYLLKVARDTEILAESGYKSVTEFAKAEYSLTADVVSRYIAINDRYSQDGYAECLAERYIGFGLAKLSEMLTLPAPVVDLIEPVMTRAEIQDVKREYAEEQNISDIEVAIEAAEQTQEQSQEDMGQQSSKPASILEIILHDYYKSNTDEYLALDLTIDTSYKELAEMLAPSGYKSIISRVPGVGKLMMAVKTSDTPVEIVNMRTNEKSSHTWNEVKNYLLEICPLSPELAKESWESVYGESFPKEEEPKPSVITKKTVPEKPKQEVKKRKEKKDKKLAVVTPKKQPEKKKIAPVQEPEEPKEILSGEVVNVIEEENNTETSVITEKMAELSPEEFKKRVEEYYQIISEEMRCCYKYIRQYEWEGAKISFEKAKQAFENVVSLNVPEEV